MPLRCAAGHDVAAVGRVLVFVGRTDGSFVDNEARPLQPGGEVIRIAKDNRDSDPASFPLVDVDRAMPRMNGDHGNAARLERAIPIGEDLVERLGCPVDEAIERDDAAETAATQGQACEIGQQDRPIRVEATGLVELAERRVGCDNRNSSLGQEASNVCRSCTDFEHRPTRREAIDEPI